MAKIKFGMMMTDARGKLGGQVFSKNRSGAYVRTKVTPVNPQSSFQQVNRSLLGSLSANWSQLTESQRTQWNNAVDQWQTTNVFGDLQKPTGKNLFTSLNKVSQANFPGNPIMVLPPSKAEFPVFQITAAKIIDGGGLSTITVSGVPTGSTFQVRATPKLSAGTQYVKNLFRNLPGSFASNETGVLAIAVPLNTRMGTYTTGDKVCLEVRQVAENGQLSAPQTIFVIVTVS